MNDQFDVIIVGAGQAGAQAAISLRQGKFPGSICIIGREAFLPYERPPLSKDFLLGEKAEDRLYLRPEAFWVQNDITILSGETVTRIRANEKSVTTHSGSTYSYDKLIWATGGNPRPLPVPGADADCVRYIRTLEDVKKIQSNLKQLDHVVIIGGGYIGLEAAAAFRKLGKKVTLIEVEDRLLGRVCAAPVSEFYHGIHAEEGVAVRLSTKVEEIVRNDSFDAIVVLGDSGEKIACDLIIVGIGIIPCVNVLSHAGVIISNGVEVNEYCQTSNPDIYAIGDCAFHENIYGGGQCVRLESVQNAIDQGKVVARHILNKPAPYSSLPWFWSDQYDLKLQTIGLNIGYDQTILRGNPDNRCFSLIYLRGGEVISIDAINRPIDYAQGRLLINKGITPDTNDLSNSDIELKEVALSAASQ